MTFAGCKIYTGMAGAAGVDGRLGFPVVALRSAFVGAVMTSPAVEQVPRLGNLSIFPAKMFWISGMDLMGHDSHVK